MKQYTEEEVDQALQSIANGQSIRRASLEWGVPRVTLQRRVLGIQPKESAHQQYQKLSPDQENHLSSWIRIQATLGHPPTHQQVRDIADRILLQRGCSQGVGKNWIQAFLKRNPSIKVLRARTIDSRRINGASTDVIRNWFKLLALPEIQAIQPHHRYNMDETGILEGRGSNGLVLGSSRSQALLKKQPGSRAWTSIIECISATGSLLPPLIIFKGKSVQQQWFSQDPRVLDQYSDWNFTATDNGWTTDPTAISWLQDVFIPATQPAQPSTPRLLILDGHGSHETTDFMWLCYSNDIYLLFLPAHSSHVLQPLDVAVYGPLKTAYRKELGYLHQATDSTAIGKRNFLACYRKARQVACSIQNIKAGWKTTGLWPISLSKPLMSPLLLDPTNNNSRIQDSIQDTSIRSRAIKNQDTAGSIGALSTPRKSIDLKTQLRLYSQQDLDPRTRRLLFQKVQKGYDVKDLELVVSQQKIQALEARLEAVRPRKKKKVQLSPNSKFASIRSIYRAQMEAGDQIDGLDGSSDHELPSDPEDCIVVAPRQSI